MIRRVASIVAAALGMLLAVLVMAPRLHPPATPPPALPVLVPEGAITSDAGMFRTAPGGPAVAFDAPGPASSRSLQSGARLRAFPGAPPQIPHPLSAEEFRFQTCKTCHTRGGWVARFGAYAPVTPHPELGACLQCHVPARDVPPFRGNTFEARERPPLGQAALAGAPPRIPHDPEMRGTCLSCHGGPSAPPEIRTTHPERVACLQCHVPAANGAGQGFERAESEEEKP